MVGAQFLAAIALTSFCVPLVRAHRIANGAIPPPATWMLFDSNASFWPVPPEICTYSARESRPAVFACFSNRPRSCMTMIGRNEMPNWRAILTSPISAHTFDAPNSAANATTIVIADFIGPPIRNIRQGSVAALLATATDLASEQASCGSCLVRRCKRSRDHVVPWRDGLISVCEREQPRFRERPAQEL